MDKPPFLASGEPARLIPVAADSSKEARAASILLATLAHVPPFAKTMLATLGLRAGKRAHLEALTEVVFTDSKSDGSMIRPDGLLILDTGGGRQWRCLVEAKIGKAHVDADQLLTYLALARKNSIDGVLTISNEFVALPTHSPVRIPKNAARGIATFHWSWMSLLTHAQLLLDDGGLEDADHQFILSEVARYFSHPSVAVTTFDRMNPEWKDLNSKVQAGAKLAKSAPEVEAGVSAWHQECRDLSLSMSRTLNRHVRQRLSRAHSDDPFLRVKEDSERLVNQHELTCTLDVPDAAAPIVVTADLRRRSIAVSSILTAPRDKQRASSRINWIVRQLTKTDPTDVHIRAHWPGRAAATQATLEALRAEPAVLESDNRALTPRQFEVLLINDIAGRFAGTRTFIELLEQAVPRFYEQVGQHLRAYVPPPPKPRLTDDQPPTRDAAKPANEMEPEGVLASTPDSWGLVHPEG